MKRLLFLPLLFVLGCSFGFKVGPGPAPAPAPIASSIVAPPTPRHPVFGSAYPSNLAGDVYGAPGANHITWALTAPSGSVSAPSYSWSGDTSTGWYHLSAGVLGFSTSGTDSAELGSETVTNLQAAGVTVGHRLYQLPVGANAETAALYIKNNYSQGTGTVGAYFEVPTTQLDTYGSAIKVMHMGGGDGVYVAQLAGATSGGAAYEAATFLDNTKGYISTKQNSVGATSNQTLFNGLWGFSDIPNYGALYLSGLPAHAITVQNFTTTSAYPQIRITTNDLSRDLFAVFPDAHLALAAPVATSGTTTNDAPIIRLNGTYWNGTASVDRSAYLVHHVTSTSPTSDFRLYLGPVGSEQLLAIQSPNTTTDATSGLTSGAGGVLDLQVGELLNVARIYNYTGSLQLGTNSTTLAQLGGASTDYVHVGASGSQLQVTPTAIGIAGTGPNSGAAQSLTLSGQNPGATNGTPGGVTVNLAAPTGSGSYPNFLVKTGTNNAAWLGQIDNGPHYGLQFGGSSFSTATAAFYTDGTNQFFQGPSGGTLDFLINQNSYLRVTANETTFSNGSGTPINGGGTGVLGIANATAAPTSNPSGGGVAWEDAAYGLSHRSSNGVKTAPGPLGQGTPDAQTEDFRDLVQVYKTTDTTAHQTMIVTLPSNTWLAVCVDWTAKLPATPSKGGSGMICGSFYNSAGTVSQIGTTTSVYSNISGAGSPDLVQPSFSVSGATAVVSVQSNDAATVDWQLRARPNIN